MKDTLQIVENGARYIIAPVMSTETFNELVANKARFGFQRGKDRGTVQHETIMEFQEEEGPLAEFFDEVTTAATGGRGSVINMFLNINKGGSSGQLDEKLFHADIPTEGEEGHENTGRAIMPWMQDRNFASLVVRIGNVELEVKVPRGAALYCTVGLLSNMHAHGANGYCVTCVIETSRPMPAPLTDQELEASASEQPSLPLLEQLGGWDPEA